MTMAARRSGGSDSERVTAMHVARRAGVSQSAVSRVFTPGASVSQRTAEKVRAAAAELGYRPNVLARSLITGRSRIIGLVVAYLENQFYPVLLERLSHALQAEGYHLLVFLAGNARSEADEVIDELLDYQVDGIIAASVAVTNDLAARCAAAGIPVVLLNRGQGDARLAEVTSDNRAGGRKVAEFLLAAGHRRIAHIAGWQGALTGRDRAAGFRDGLQDAGLSPCAEPDGLYSRDRAADIARELATGPSPPDAIFVGNDHMAFGVLDMLRHELGLQVPGDISVVGYDDVPLAAWAAYGLTTVRQPVARMVAETVACLMDRIEGRADDARHVKIEGPLIVRTSARVPQGWKS